MARDVYNPDFAFCCPESFTNIPTAQFTTQLNIRE